MKTYFDINYYFTKCTFICKKVVAFIYGIIFFHMLRVAVIGGGPSGSCAAEILAKSGIKTWLFERKAKF